MDSSISMVLPEILGIILAVVGLGMLCRGKVVLQAMNEIVERPGTLWLMGFMALIAGAILVGIYNVWSSGWMVLVTIIGWLALLKGFVILLFPATMTKLYRKLVGANTIVLAGTLSLIIGLILLYVSTG